MTILVFLWAASLFVIAGVTLYASFRAPMVASNVPSGILEFVREEIYQLIERIFVVFHSLRPHTSKVGLVLSHYGKRGHVAFSERLFGKIQTPPGKTASFFLKYIAEQKEKTRNRAPRRIGY